MKKTILNIKFNSENPYQKEINLYLWCKELARLYFQGKLEQEKIDKLNSIGFEWDFYKD